METERYLDHSSRITWEDLDWEAGRQAGLTEEERFVLTYFSDIESQTIIYLRDLLHTSAVREPETIGFLSMWNYEEYFHGQALAQLLRECGYPLTEGSISQVREGARIGEKLKALGGWISSRFFQNEFPALYTTWGATNEMTTLRGYESLEAKTKNPVLQALCQRIAKQERRHFAWYYNSAKERLERSPSARRFTRWVMAHVWSPVGVGVKSRGEAARLIRYLFPDCEGREFAEEIDQKISSLPGLKDVELMGKFLRKASVGSL